MPVGSGQLIWLGLVANYRVHDDSHRKGRGQAQKDQILLPRGV